MGHGLAGMSCIVPLTCLAQDIVEAILDGRQPKETRLAEMLGSVECAWEQQQAARRRRHFDPRVKG
jgi:hypothetical protein